MNGTKHEDCGSVEVEMRNGEVGVKDGEVGWTPVVRRRKGASSEESDISENLNVMMDINQGRSLV